MGLRKLEITMNLKKYFNIVYRNIVMDEKDGYFQDLSKYVYDVKIVKTVGDEWIETESEFVKFKHPIIHQKVEVQYLKRIYNINLELISRDKIEKHIAIINSIIITIDLFIYFNFNSVTLSLVVIFFVTFVLIAIFYTILGNIYRKYR